MLRSFMVAVFFLSWHLLCVVSSASASATVGDAAGAASAEEIVKTNADPVRETCHITSPVDVEADVNHHQGSCSLAQPASTSEPSFWENLLQSASVPSYYLMWSPGAIKKSLVSSLWLSVLHVYRDFIWSGISLVFPPSSTGLSGDSNAFITNNNSNSVILNLLLPLLSSACCSLQLGLNLFGIGCAGFNTYLGPWRPYFVSVLLYGSLVLSPPTTTISTVMSTITRFVMALLPEGLHLWNTYYYSHINNNNDLLDSTKMDLSAASSSSLQTYRVQLDIPTMGCVACINKINTSLMQLLHVQQPQSSTQPITMEGSSWLYPKEEEKGNKKGGGAVSLLLSVKEEQELEPLIAQIQSSIEKAGFENSQLVSKTRVHVESDTSGDGEDAVSTGTCSTNDIGNDETSQKSPLSSKNQQQQYHVIPPLTQIEMSIPTMSCGGCVAEVNAAAKQASTKVVKTTSQMNENKEGGHATIWVKAVSKEELETILQDLQASLDNAGFFDNVVHSTDFVQDKVDELTTTTTAAAAAAAAAEVTWRVPGMTCDGCIESIHEAIYGISFEEKAFSIDTVASKLLVNSKGGRSTVSLKVGSLAALEDAAALIETAIQDAGYDESLQRELTRWYYNKRQEQS